MVAKRPEEEEGVLLCVAAAYINPRDSRDAELLAEMQRKAEEREAQRRLAERLEKERIENLRKEQERLELERQEADRRERQRMVSTLSILQERFENLLQCLIVALRLINK